MHLSKIIFWCEDDSRLKFRHFQPKNVLKGRRAETMRVIKRNGSEVDFDIQKIITAITKANDASVRRELTGEQIREAILQLEQKWNSRNISFDLEIEDVKVR